MRAAVAALLCVVLAPVCCSAATSAADGRTKEFPEYRCRLTLPGPGYRWLDHTQVPHCVALFADASGTIKLAMVAGESPEGAVIDEDFVKAFDSGFIEPGGVSKISGRIGRFRGVPCYQLHAQFKGASSPATIRVFAANGYVFQLQLHGSNLPVGERNKLEPVFSAFEFVGEPELPAPKPEPLEKTIARSAAKYKLIGLGLAAALAAIILCIRDAARRSRKRRAPR